MGWGAWRKYEGRVISREAERSSSLREGEEGKEGSEGSEGEGGGGGKEEEEEEEEESSTSSVLGSSVDENW